MRCRWYQPGTFAFPYASADHEATLSAASAAFAPWYSGVSCGGGTGAVFKAGAGAAGAAALAASVVRRDCSCVAHRACEASSGAASAEAASVCVQLWPSERQ